MPERKVIACVGPSCSFKSTTAELLEQLLIGSRIRGDDFYEDEDTLARKGRARPKRGEHTDYESPEAVDLGHLAECLSILRGGAESVVTPEYSRAQHRRVGEQTFRPHPEFGRNIILDSLFALHDPVAQMVDHTVAIDISDDLVFKRRRTRQGDEYSEAYHCEVMVPSLAEARALWRERAQVVICVRDRQIDGQDAKDEALDFWIARESLEVVFLWDESTPEKKQTSGDIANLLECDLRARFCS